MRLTKEEFCAAVDEFQQMSDNDVQIINALNIVEWEPTNWLDTYYNLLVKMCDFEEDDYTVKYGTDLDYYCYILDFGRKWKPGMITKDGKDIPCRNSEELWNMIMGGNQ